MPLFAPPSSGAGDGKVLPLNVDPVAGDGINGDVALVHDDTTLGASALLVGPKAAGAWPVTKAWGPDGSAIVLPYRHKSMLGNGSGLIPGWNTVFSASWFTGACPTDLTRVGGPVSNAFASNTSGTTLYLGRSRQGAVSMPFFSLEADITALPEASRFAWFGQIGYDGAPYGYTLRVDSAGVCQIWRLDGVFGDARIGTGTFTIAAGDIIVFERFGLRLTAYKCASGTRDLVSVFSAKVRHTTSGGDGFAWLFGSQSYGYITNSSSVRVARMDVMG